MASQGQEQARNGNGEDEATAPLERTFAVMLAELEDTETELTLKQSELARELQGVNEQLDRVATVKRAMLGPKVGRPKGNAGSKNPTETSKQNKDKARKYAKQRGAEWWTPADMATAYGMPKMGVGPILAPLVNDGELERRERREDGRMVREYRLVQA